MAEGGAADIPGDTWVLRGGDLSGVASRDKNLRRVHRAYAIWGICVSAEPGKSVGDIAHYKKFGNEKMMTALAQELRDAGFDVVREPGAGWPSALITFPDEPTADDWAKLRRVMTVRSLLPNPGYKGPKD